ncbi:MAG: nitrile hydratase subunit alpha [Candidatus Eremiobacteraeota bacterium]|nr:nitrile hydratase subunit alpha [Candidatus Eremiobacteraeota bacterium]MBC5822071.1 nitrile hydratase subunit alpha [Candidatus Eremiobacteraeota bacterium]
MAQRVSALIARIEAVGMTSDAEISDVLERFLASASPANGAKLVARAWVEPAFKALLLEDASAALERLAIDMSHWAPVRLQAVENSALLHNVIVCTLCSCYPIALLGPPPTWYKSEAYRSRVVREPRAMLAEFGVTLGSGVEVRVWDSTAELRYIVVPERPVGTDGWTQERLASLITRDALIGVARPSLQVAGAGADP